MGDRQSEGSETVNSGSNEQKLHIEAIGLDWVSKHIITKPMVNVLLLVDEVEVRRRISALPREISVFLGNREVTGPPCGRGHSSNFQPIFHDRPCCRQRIWRGAYEGSNVILSEIKTGVLHAKHYSLDIAFSKSEK
jgi:hypothetical protein